MQLYSPHIHKVFLFLAAKDIGIVRRLELFDESNIIAVIPSNDTNYGMLLIML